MTQIGASAYDSAGATNAGTVSTHVTEGDMRNVLQTYGNACIATKADLVVAKAAAHRLMLAIVAAEQAHYDNAADEVAQFLAAADHALDKCGDAIEAARIAFDAECQFVATRKAA